MTLALGMEDRSAHVVVIESAASARQLIGTVVQELGFKNVSSMDSIQAGLDFLSQEKADFVICPLVLDDFPNALHFLKVLRSHAELQHIPVSLFVSEEGHASLPSAFEMGALSWHARVFSKEAVLFELNELMTTLKQSGFHTPSAAIHYLHLSYASQSLFQTSREVLQDFLSHFPDSRQARLSLADAFLASGEVEEGKKLLGQFKAIGFEGWESVARRHFNSLDEVPAQIGFTPCLVIDGDESVHNNLKKIFEEFPEFRVVPFSSGLAADQWCRENGTPGLIIQEWKCRDLPGPAFLQRIRQRGWHDVPIVVLSSLVTRNDAPLLKEMGVTEVFEKPLEKDPFVEALVFALMQEKDPTDLAILEGKISRLLNMGNTEYALLLKARVDGHPRASLGHKKYIESLFLFHQENFEAAKVTAMEAAQNGGESLKCLTVLARSLVRLRDFDAAVKCFEKARSISPANVERLCELAGVLADLGKHDRAEEAIGDAARIDKDSELVQQTASQVAIKAGDTAKAKSIILHMSRVSGLVSEMNNSAVALVKVGDFEKALALYRHTIDSLPEELVEVRLRVIYNLALAYARAGRLKECLAEIEDPPKDEQEELAITKKMDSLRRKVTQSLESKRPLKLVSDQDEETLSAKDEVGALGMKKENSDSLVMESGQAGLFGLFSASAEERAVTTKSLEREANFILGRVAQAASE